MTIVKTYNTLNGKARIDGTRISVSFIIEQMNAGMQISEFKEAFDLNELQIKEAILYYEAHKEEIDIILQRKL